MRSAQALMFATFHVAGGDVLGLRVDLLLEKVDGTGAATTGLTVNREESVLWQFLEALRQFR